MGSEEGGPPDGGSGLTFPGMQDGDTAAYAGDSVTLDGIATVTTPLFDTSSLGGSYLCTTVTVNNGGDDSASFNALDWKVQDPGGAIRSSTFTGSDTQLNSGEVAPGGSVSGDVCFDNPGGSPPGQYIVLNDPSFDFADERIGWINQR